MQCFRCCCCCGRLSRVDCWCGIGVCRAKREEEAKRSAKCAASRFSTSMAKVEPLHYRCALHSEAAARCPRAGPAAGPGRHRHDWQRSSAFVGDGAGGGWVEMTRPPSVRPLLPQIALLRLQAAMSSEEMSTEVAVRQPRRRSSYVSRSPCHQGGKGSSIQIAAAPTTVTAFRGRRSGSTLVHPATSRTLRAARGWQQ